MYKITKWFIWWQSKPQDPGSFPKSKVWLLCSDSRIFYSWQIFICGVFLCIEFNEADIIGIKMLRKAEEKKCLFTRAEKFSLIKAKISHHPRLGCRRLKKSQTLFHIFRNIFSLLSQRIIIKIFGHKRIIIIPTVFRND